MSLIQGISDDYRSSQAVHFPHELGHVDHSLCEQDLGAGVGHPVAPQEEHLLVLQADNLQVVTRLLHEHVVAPATLFLDLLLLNREHPGQPLKGQAD